MAAATMATSTAALSSHITTVQTSKAEARSSVPMRRTFALSSGQQADAVKPPDLDMVTPLEAEEELSQATLIWRSHQLLIYSVALVPLAVGAAAVSPVRSFQLTSLLASSLVLCARHQVAQSQVRLGTVKGSKLVQTAVVSLYSLIVALTSLKAFVFRGSFQTAFIGQNHANKYNIFMAKYYCVRLHVALGTALVLGLLSASMPPAAAKFWSTK